MRITAALLLVLLLGACAQDPPRLGPDPASAEWAKRLESESERPPLVTFGRTGKVSAVAGAFHLDDRSAGAVSRWLLARREMFGLGGDDSLRLAGTSARDEAPTESSVRYVFDVVHQGHAHSGMQLVTTVLGNRSTLVSVLNTFAGAKRAGLPLKLSSEESAWQAAEARFGAALVRTEAVQVWFDPSWALRRVPGTQELHWRLLGRDAGGAPQYAFIRASDNHPSYATPPVTRFAVRQTHKDHPAGNVLWDSQTLPNGCVAGSPGCSGKALSESLLSRDIFPKVVDLWYRMSTPGGPGPFVWPFSGLNRAPLDNAGGRPFSVVVANPPKAGLNVADLPTRDGSSATYNFPEGTVTRGFVGHEYGHALLAQLKQLHPGNTGTDPFSPAAAFTEAMADFIGIVSDHLITGAIPRPPSVAHWQTDFSIGDFKYDVNGSVIEPPLVAWDIRAGDCVGAGRARLGRAFINAWGMDVQFFGDRPRAVGEATYRAWWIDIMRSFALLPDFSFPTIKDFYDATVSRTFTYDTPTERVPALFLKGEMEKLGLDVEGCR